MTSVNLQQWISHPEVLNKETLYELRLLLARYPYCQSLRLLYLKNLYILHDTSFGVELRKSVLYIPDLKVLFYLIEGDRYLLPVQPREYSFSEELKGEGLDRTLSLIDAFLSTVPEEDSATELDYAMDYTPFLMKEDFADHLSTEEPEQKNKLRRQELIDGFIAKVAVEPAIKMKPLEENDEILETPDLSFAHDTDDDSYFTETLAKIYIKQQRYSKALEIIKKLSLKYPKKNIYFADQIRFLEKLIINANSK